MRLRNTRWALAYWLLLGLLPFLSHRTKAQTGPTQTLTFAAVADTYVDANAATTNFNSAVEVLCDASPVRIGYLRFAVTGVAGRTVQHARIRLQVTNASNVGGTIHKISNTTWNEATITSNTKPAVDGPGLQTLGAVTVGSVVEFNVDGAITADGVYSFALDNTSTSAAGYASNSATSGQKPQLVLTVSAAPPTIQITQPPTGATFFVGDTITLQGQASDANSQNLSSSIAWSSNLAGALGTGAILTPALGQGTHVLTASVTDGQSLTSTTSVTVTVNPRPAANTEPLVAITAPSNNQMIPAGLPVTFTGTASDLEDGTLTSALAWSSDRDGALGTGGTFSHSLSQGTHHITATVTDHGGLHGSATITVQVQPAVTVEFPAVADAHVDAGQSGVNFGSSNTLRVDANTARITYLRFVVNGIGSRPITQALVRMQIDGTAGADSDSGGTLHTISDGTWQESTITYDNRPAVDGPVVATAGPVTLGQVVDFDVSSAVTGDGTYNFALPNLSSDEATYRSREGGPAPTLVLLFAGNAPTVSINAPASGLVAFRNDTITFMGSATDVEDGSLTSQIHWSSDRDGNLGTGGTLPVSTLSVGTHVITASATDSDQLTAQAQITVRVRNPNAAPQVVISAPVSGSSVAIGTAVALAATATDDFDGTLTSGLAWSSSRDGSLGSGGSLSATHLTIGTHVLTASVRDSDGVTGSASVTLTVTPTPPTVTISAPANGVSVFGGTSVTFTGSATDAGDGNLSGALRWTSSLSGVIGAGASFSTSSLAVGTHTITASVTNSSSVTGQAQRTITVRPPNAAPSVTLLLPTSGGTYLAGKPLLLAATASDPENGDLSSAIRWSSSRDGNLGTGATLTVSSLTVGSHTLLATVTDNDGTSASATTSITVTPATLTFNAIADTYVSSGSTTTKFGTATSVQVDSSPICQTFLRFTTSGIGSFAVQSATLRMTVGSGSADGSPIGGTVNSITNNTWSEATTTYSTRPAIDGPALATRAAVTTNQVVDFDVTAGVAGDGTFNFALSSTSSDNALYKSRENSSGGPQLIVALKQDTTPLVVITAPANGATILPTQSATFTGRATDAESGDLSAQIQWVSSIDGVLGTGATLTVPHLHSGTHTITARVTDSGGKVGQATRTIVVPNIPVVTITSPADGSAVFQSALPMTLTGRALDVEDGDISAYMQWRSDRDGALATGPSISVSSLSIGTHVITATATDDDGLVGTAQISLRVRGPNQTPQVTISAPADGGSTPAGTSVSFAGAASDDFDTNLAAQIRWTSSRDGLLCTGATCSKVLTEGVHTITASVTDSNSATGSASVGFTVTPTAPEVAISAPADGTRVFGGTPVTFTGTATDATDGSLTSHLAWSSDRDGALGTGGSVTATHLSIGTHVVTAQVTDAGGLTTHAARTVIVRPPNVPPTIAITAPTAGATLLNPGSVVLGAVASDSEDGNLSTTIRWTSSRDGVLGTGATLTVASLSVGAHTLTATVTVVPAVITLLPVADTYVDSGATSTIFGTATSVLAGTGPIRNAFFRFTVSGIGSVPVQSAILRLTAGTASADAAAAGGTLHTMTDNTWSEAATKYSNRPTIDGPVIATAGKVAIKQVVDFNVASAIAHDGTYNLGLDLNSSDYVRYGSREASTGKPQLIITLGQNTAPAVSILAPATGSRIKPGTPVTLTGVASDAQSGDLSSQITWTSDRDGMLGTGASVVVSSLSSGPHVITAQVTDAGGAIGQAHVDISVAYAPQVAITSPANGSIFFVDQFPLTFAGTAFDQEDGDLASSMQWSSSRDGALATGPVIRVDSLTIGTHVITAGVTDSEHLHGEAQMTIRVRGPNQPPTVAITSPANGAAIPAGMTATLTASANDDFDGDLGSQVHWSSNRDGMLGTGASISRILTEGVHTLTATVTDSDGASAQSQITLTITPTPPAITITAPAIGTRVFGGTNLTFTGTAIDATDGNLSASLRWTSDRDGLIGTGPTFSTSTLTTGTHVITASASDSGSLVGHATRTVVIRTVNVPPTVTIVAPTNTVTLLAGRPVVLGGRALDTDDGDLSPNLRWTSSKDGNLGTGATVTVASLTTGTHTITASVTDADGAPGTASVTVTVIPATLTFSAVADTYVDSGKATTKFGTATSVLVASSPVQQAFFRFGVGGIGSLGVQQALLRLTVGSASADASANGGTVNKITNNTWSESTTTYQTRPAIDGPVLATKGKVAIKTVVDFDVTAGVTGDATYNFSIVTPITDNVRYATREASTGKPQLIVTLKQNTNPVVNISAPTNGAVVGVNAAVTFNGVATDAESGNISSQIQWSSSRDGVLGTGGTLTVPHLSPGAHTITARVTDAGGLAGQAQIQIQVGHKPEVIITAPSDRAVFFTAQLPFSLVGTATDTEDGVLTQRLAWTSDRDGALGVGGSVGVRPSIGTHVISADVTDAHGEVGHAQITIKVRGPNQAPTLTISNPTDGAQIPAGTQLTLTATAQDDFDGNLSSVVRWTDDRNGVLGTGAPQVTLHGEGAHVVTATVTDSDGVSTSAQVTVTITPTAPVVTITTPANNSTVVQDTSVSFNATALDATDGDLATGLRWISNRDGEIGTGGSFSISNLSEGVHTITAAVSDSGGLVGLANMTLTVIRQPTVTILLPENDAHFLNTTGITFFATAADRVDGDVSSTLVWTSDKDGEIGRGMTFTKSNLSLGTHTITARAVNHVNNPASASIMLTVQVASLTFEPVADTYVDDSLTTTNFGTAPELIAGAGVPSRQTFLRFNLSGLTGFPIDNAKLKLTVGSSSTASGGAGGTLRKITNNSWTEGNTTYKTKPTIDGAILDSVDLPVGATQVVQWTIPASAITGDGSYNFALTSASTDGVKYESREGTHRPQLVVFFSQPQTRALPTVTITAPASGTTIFDDETATLTATANDTRDGNISSQIVWKSSIDGPLGTGASLSLPHLTRGSHTITAQITDSIGLIGQTAIVLTIADRPPDVRISTPLDAAIFAPAFPIVFNATATDNLDGDIGASIAWSSDRQGALGTGRTITVSNLSDGDHVITAQVTNSLGTAGSKSITISVGNATPRLTVTAPADNSNVPEGTPITLTATATDVEDGNLTSSIVWSSNLQGALGTGGSVPVTLNAGSHVLTASVTDSQGGTRTVTLNVTVDLTPPVLTILSPADGTGFSGTVTLSGHAVDVRDGDKSNAIRWSSNVAGTIGTGSTVTTRSLGAGRHVITAQVTDSDGLTASQSITIGIGNTPPTVSITAPATGTSSIAGVPLTLSATATDALDGTLSSSITWSSNLNGPLGTGASINTAVLARGTHVITARAADSKGLSGTDQIVVSITASAGTNGNQPPQVTIAAPSAGAQVAVGANVSFTGTAIDEAGDISPNLAWVSNIDGVIGTGRTFSTTTLSPGSHRIMASVADSGGLVGSATVAITVTSSASTFPVVADAYTDGSAANVATNFGTAAVLRLQNSPVLRIYLRFNVTGLTAGSIPRAVLRLTTTPASNSGAAWTTGSGGEVHLLTEPSAWDELTITHNAKPGLATAITQTVETAINPSQVVEWDVTSVLNDQVALNGNANGTYNLALKTLSGDRAEFVSREGGVGAPELVVFRDLPTATNPTVHITAPAEGTLVSPGVATGFTATATDPQDGNIAPSLVWRSNRDGVLGTGPSITATLSAGTHVITATATDSQNTSAADLIHVTVGAGAAGLTIVAPANGASAPVGTPVPFIGTAFDTKDGDLSFSIQWTSSIDGNLGSGPSFLKTLSVGTHTITATIVDSDHNTTTTSITFQVTNTRVGYEDFSFGPNIEVALDKATATKQQSKLWVQDGIWWGLLFNQSKSAVDIYRMDVPTQTWIDTGTLVDDRGKSRGDVLVDGNKLYVASRFGFGVSPAQNKLMRYTYFPGAQTYVMDPGFPVNMPGGGCEALTIAKDSLGHLWTAFNVNDFTMASHTVNDDTDWVTPFTLPAPEGAIAKVDDDADVIAMPGGQIGIYWSNQILAKDYFALHTDGMGDLDPAAWKWELVSATNAVADDHTNMKLGSDGRLWVAQKTSRTTLGQTLVGLFVRTPDGTWSTLYKVGNVDVDPTRPQLVLDEANSRVCLFYSSFFSDVYYKCTDTENINFGDGNDLGTPLMKSGTSPVSPAIGGPGGINNPSGQKNNPDPSTGILMIAATSETNRYWHNWVELPSPRPVVTLTSPTDGLKVKTGSTLTFSATGLSDVDGIVTSAIKWTSNRDGQIGTGGSFTKANLTRGVHTITASVTDSTKLTGNASITVTVEDDVAPVVTVSSPATGGKFRPDQSITFTGTAIDSLDGDRTANLVWTSDRDGQLGTGGSFARTGLSVGRHIVTARATDTANLAGTATITLDIIVPAPPVLTLTAPVDAKLYAFGAMVPFTATANDSFDGNITSQIAWSSDRDGNIGTGGSFTRSTLSRGTHTITASITDSGGLVTTAARSITIVDEAPPVVTIVSPAAGALFAAGKPVTLTGTAIDVIDGDRSAQITWSSNRDGAIGAGATLVTSSLSVGTHTITASATDLAGLTAVAQVSIEVRIQPAPTVAITAPANNAVVLFTQAATFTGTATDTIDGNIASAIRWTSDKDGLLGTGASISKTLSLGIHTITASATNSNPLTGTASITVSVESGPQIAILSPVDGSTAALGDAVTFTALAFDFEDGDLSNALHWSSSRDGNLGTGATITTSTLTRGVHTITAQAVDNDGHVNSAQIAIEVIAKPTVLIVSPANNTLVGFGASVTFSGFATDPTDGNLSSSLTWTSSLDGVIGNGGSFATTALRSGTHVVTARATNSRGLSGTKTVTVVVNDPPTLTVTSPLNNSTIAQGTAVTFSASATDREDGTLTSAIAWTSSRDGNIGTGGSFTLTTLSAGLHTLTATVTDSGGRVASTTRSVLISGRPAVTISAPIDGTRIQLGDAITFTATAADFEDGDVTGSMTWTSSRDGLLGSGGSITRSNLTAGTHTIVAQATDHDGLTGQRTVTVIVNAPPAVTIVGPPTGTTFEKNAPVIFTGTATDAEDGNIASGIHWISNLDGALGTGASITTSALRSGSHTITASVTDSAGRTVSTTITVTINATPTVTITAPAHGSVFSPNQSIAFTATATDPEDGDLGTSIAWTSNLDGAIGTGGSLNIGFLRSGTHVITAAATDTAGKRGTAQITITVNGGPSLTITGPADGTNVIPGTALSFTANATDLEDGNLASTVGWSSSLDGTLGTGSPLSVSTLRSGTHTITASVTDSGGKRSSAAITVIVNAFPTVAITAPADGATFEHGATVTFTGTANDTEDGPITAISWSSNLDGALGTGASVSSSALRSGTHTITASVTDAGGKTASATRTIVVNSTPTVSITAPATGSTYEHGQAITFTATAADFEDPSLTVQWSSSRDGNLGSGASLTKSTLSSGTHTITASVTDSGGKSASATISIVVNSTPTISVTAPGANATFEHGQTVIFTASAADLEDGTPTVAWSSSRDGALGNGLVLSTATLSSGTHTVTATATDAGGKSASASVTIVVNSTPTIGITAPATGSSYEHGQAITFAATASDVEDATLSIRWSSSLDGDLGTGSPISISSLRSGTHTITAAVTDSGGKSASATITVVVNSTPTVSITAPATGSSYEHGAAITFVASASDVEDASVTVQWSSSRDGSLGSGASLTRSNLTSGTHTITASVTDSGGKTGTATITVVVNSTPTVSITAPATGSSYEHGATVAFAATASDLEDASLTINWSSNLDGSLGSGAALNVASLRSGTHTITASTTDSGGKTGSSSISVVVNSTPTVSITAPANNATYEHGAAITFTASAADLEDASVTVQWGSNRDGALGTGPSLTRSNLTSGTHLITASVTDSGGKTATTSITVVVNSTPVVTITAPANNSNYEHAVPVTFTGTSSDLEDGTPIIHWSSSRDGDLGTGASITTSGLSSGTHIITASVTDTGGKTASQTITVIVDSAPTVSIITPADGSTYEHGATVTLSASAFDLEDGTPTVHWSSNRDGSLGTGETITTSTLTSGTHFITASVTDSGGKTATSSITITVNSTPTVSITAPAGGATYEHGATVMLAATASDLEDASLVIHWSSDRDGTLGTGATLNVSTLSSGTHGIMAMVTDSGGKSATATVTVTVNSTPTVQITAPATNSTYEHGAAVNFTATSNDLEDGTGLTITWSSSRDGTLGTGNALTTTALSSGTHTITASVTDMGGKVGSASVTVVVNSTPSVAIIAPTSGASYEHGASVSFTGSATDLEDGTLTVHWSSSLDGSLGTGNSLTVATLSSGTHTITAQATDAGGKSASQTITVVVNSTPTISITAPAANATFEHGATVTLTASASDLEDASLTVVWLSSRDGALGSGATLPIATLSSGTHTITASVTDSGGKTASAQVTITVDSTPTVAITGPADGSTYEHGATVTFTGTSSDLEDGTPTIHWASDRDGDLGTGTSLPLSTLSSGTHVVTASVTDAGGKTASAHITITVDSTPTVAITGPADGSVYEPGATVTLTGTSSDLEDGTPTIHWSSNLQGDLGTGTSLPLTTLNSGTHTIVATVTDAGGKTASAQITVVINATPTVSIDQPADGSTFAQGDTIAFAGTGTDTEDGALVITWSSDLDGQLGTGASLATNALTAGTHVVTASVTDSGNKTASAHITLVIQ